MELRKKCSYFIDVSSMKELVCLPLCLSAFDIFNCLKDMRVERVEYNSHGIISGTIYFENLFHYKCYRNLPAKYFLSYCIKQTFKELNFMVIQFLFK